MFNSVRSRRDEADKRDAADGLFVSQHSSKPHVGSRIVCFFLGHVKINKVCQRCGQQFGVPKMDCPPEPP